MDSRREVALQVGLRDAGIDRGRLVGFLLDAMGALGAEVSVGVRVVGDRTMATLNRKFRGKAGPTDVLSFPSGEPDETGLPYLGDIAIGGRVAERASKENGIGLEAEYKRLLLHGLLHLLGHDHETDGGRMVRKERTLRRRFGL